MSGTFPASPKYSTLEIESNQPALVSKAESGKRIARKVGGHLWSMRVQFPIMSRAEFSPIDAFVMSQDGGYGSFDIAYTLENQGTWINAATPAVNGAVAAGDNSLNINILAAGQTISAGDIFRTSTHNKVYKVVTGGTAGAQDNILDELGGAILDEALGNIWDEESFQVTGVTVAPEFIADVANNVVLTHTNVHFHMYLKTVHEFKVNAPELYRYELDLEESI